MEIEIKNKQVFPAEIIELLKAFYLVGFFEEAMLVGSWVMLLYHEAFGVRYAIRTQDIDFAVKFVSNAKSLKMDIEKIITDLGYLPVISQSGIYKYTRKNLSVEFIAHRKGGRDDEVSHIREWNITAMPLPFVDLLLRFPFTGDVGEFKVKAPLPEAFFVHKLITSQRRPDESKKDKDLEWVFAAIPAIYCGVKANYTINMFHTNEEPRCLQRGSSTMLCHCRTSRL